MPGHPVGDSQLEETNAALDQLEELIKNHDVIYLLTDSRESRWLPTMLAAYHKKASYSKNIFCPGYGVRVNITKNTVLRYYIF